MVGSWIVIWSTEEGARQSTHKDFHLAQHGGGALSTTAWLCKGQTQLS